MFTGLIEKVGELIGLDESSGGVALTIGHDAWDAPLRKGESVAIQGVCLTVVNAERERFECDLLAETLAKTNLGGKRPGARLNLERAVKAGDRLGGHMLMGHVDGVGALVDKIHRGRDVVLRVSCAKDLIAAMVPKGSVGCDGISLTIAGLETDSFEVDIIPFTWERTSLPGLQICDTLNLETDILGKYVRRFMETRHEDSALTVEKLANAGFE